MRVWNPGAPGCAGAPAPTNTAGACGDVGNGSTRDANVIKSCTTQLVSLFLPWSVAVWLVTCWWMETHSRSQRVALKSQSFSLTLAVQGHSYRAGSRGQAALRVSIPHWKVSLGRQNPSAQRGQCLRCWNLSRESFSHQGLSSKS